MLWYKYLKTLSSAEVWEQQNQQMREKPEVNERTKTHIKQPRDNHNWLFSAESNVSPYKKQKTVANFLAAFKIRRKLQILHRIIIIELGSYQGHIIRNYQENTFRGTGVQESFLQNKMAMLLIISCGISKTLTRNSRKIQCVCYPLYHDSYTTLSSSNKWWTHQIFSGSITCVFQWRG